MEALAAVWTPRWWSAPTGARCSCGPTVLRGARAVAEQALAFAHRAPYGRPALVNGAAGVVVAAGVRLIAVMGFTVTDGKITEIDILADPERLRHVDLTALGNRPG